MCFVPSEEGLSLVAMEAMSAKRQVVTMNSSGAYELLNHAGCGTFYKEDDESSVANAVKKYSKHRMQKRLNVDMHFAESKQMRILKRNHEFVLNA